MKVMIENKISFEIAKYAKELGFSNIWSYSFYYPDGELEYLDNTCYCNDLDVNECSCGVNERIKDWKKHYPAPTQALFQKFLREKYDINILIYKYPLNEKYGLDTIQHNGVEYNEFDSFFETYEEALEFCFEFVRDELKIK